MNFELGEKKQKMVMTEKRLIKNSKIVVKQIFSKKTQDNMTANIDEFEPINYFLMQKYIKDNKKALFDKYKRIQIDILTPTGWRAGHVFESNGEIDFYSSAKEYIEKVGDVMTIYAVQILLFDKK
jgi:hypothetical protein